jgi:uncharacterized membrane protein
MSGERTIVQAALIGTVVATMTSILLVIGFLDKPLSGCLDSLQPEKEDGQRPVRIGAADRQQAPIAPRPAPAMPITRPNVLPATNWMTSGSPPPRALLSRRSRQAGTSPGSGDAPHRYRPDTASTRSKGARMAIGPVQLIVLGFSHPEFHGEIIEELERLRESDTVRVIDALAVHKDADGEIEVAHLSNLTKDEAIELGTKIGALIGLGIEGEEGMVAGAEAGAETAAEGNGVHVFSDEEAWDVLEEIPNDSAAALILLEHHWAVPLRDAIARAGGFRLSDGFISPLDLVEIGLMSREEAEQLHAMETAAGASA